MRDIDDLIVHCSSTYDNQDIGAAEIRRVHVEENGWKDIGYHYVIRRNGTVEPGRSEDTIGAHVAGHNAHSIGICLVGGLSHVAGKTVSAANFTYAQYAALESLLRRLMLKYPKAALHGHCDYANKDCPCFDVQRWWKERNESAKIGGTAMLKSLIALVCAVSLAFPVTGCGLKDSNSRGDVAKNAARVLAVSQVTYLAAVRAVNSAYDSKLVTLEQRDKAYQAARIYRETWLSAATLLYTFVSVDRVLAESEGISEDMLRSVVAECVSGLNDFTQALISLGIAVKSYDEIEGEYHE
jgi:hypothetical protein